MLLCLSVFMLPLIAGSSPSTIVAAEDGKRNVEDGSSRARSTGQVFYGGRRSRRSRSANDRRAALAVVARRHRRWGGLFITVGHASRATVRLRAGKACCFVFAVHAVYLIPLFALVIISPAAVDATANSAGRRLRHDRASRFCCSSSRISPGSRIKPYLLTEQYENWHGLLRTRPTGHPILAFVVGLHPVRRPVR